MKKIKQTFFGGSDTPKNGDGNCFQACVASILEIPLEGSFNHGVFSDDEWFEKFNDWLKQYGLASIFIECGPDNPMCSTPLRGIHIAEMETKESSLKHAVVIDSDKIIHDPMPYPSGKEYTCCGIYFFVPLDPRICRALV